MTTSSKRGGRRSGRPAAIASSVQLGIPLHQQTLVVLPGPRKSIVHIDGRDVPVPDGWEMLPAGDAGLTRAVKSAGPSWTVKEKSGRRIFSKGVWAPSEHIAAAKINIAAKRATPQYAARKRSDAKRRETKQTQYVDAFENAILQFLNFHANHRDLAGRMAAAVAKHATPIGSGTVARTQRIPIEERAAAAVIAWMRHQTTAYDNMVIPRVKGKRRETRRLLAQQSRKLLDRYRSGNVIDPNTCPLAIALC